MKRRQEKDSDWIEKYNDWRDRYNLLDYGDHQYFWNMIEKDWPDQFQCKVDILISFAMSMIKDPSGKLMEDIRVLELGGWKGEVARLVLESPLRRRISTWTNYEICPNVLDKQVCKDPVYEVRVPDKWFWNCPIPDQYDLFVSSHCIEHTSRDHLKKLFVKLNDLHVLKYLYLEAPLPLDIVLNSWTDYRGSHKLEIGWLQVRRLLEVHEWTALYFDQLAGTLGATMDPGIF